jgi:TolB-like protein
MPLRLVGTTEEDAHLAPGLTEEITTALARFRWMFVVASNSLARFAAEDRDETAIRRTFGIHCHFDSPDRDAWQKPDDVVRLLDLRAGNQVVWARRFDRQSNDLLSLQDEIASEVVAQIDPEILLIEAKRSASRPPMDATAYDLMLRSIPLIGRLERRPSCRRANTYPVRLSWRPNTLLRTLGMPIGKCSWSARIGRTIPRRQWKRPASTPNALWPWTL